MRNASGLQGENERQWKIKANMNTENKILRKLIRQFLLKNNVQLASLSFESYKTAL